MAEIRRDEAVVNARIVYWGIEASGKTTNLRVAHRKLRPDHRGELREVPTRLDPTVSYEMLPIELGEIAGMRTRIQMIAVPGGAEQAPTRKQLLDQVDGIVLVIDSQPQHLDANVAIFSELRQALASYGRALDDIPLIIQYNKRDLSDPYSIEALHRKLDVPGAPVFETVATEETGVLQTLSTISKRVVRSLRGGEANPAEARPGDSAPAAGEGRTRVDFQVPSPTQPTTAERMERAIETDIDDPETREIDATALETASLMDDSWERLSADIGSSGGATLGPGLSIVSVGEASRAGDRAMRIPVVFGDAEGRTTSMVLSIQLDPLIDDEPG